MRRNFWGLTVIVMTALFVCGCEDTAQAPEDGQPAPAAQEPAAQEPAVDKQEPVQLIPARPDSAAGEKVESEEPAFWRRRTAGDRCGSRKGASRHGC